MKTDREKDVATKSEHQQLIDRICEFCLSLPEAHLKPFGGHSAPTFRVNDKLFIQIHEDLDGFTCKAPPGVQQALVAADPDRFFVPAYVGHRGWIGVRLNVDQEWEELAEIIEDSYRMTAPRRVVAQHDAAKK
jgi:hypothetical protein